MKLSDFTVIDEPIPHIAWEELEAKMPKAMHDRFCDFMYGQTCIQDGAYASDVERFLLNLPVID